MKKKFSFLIMATIIFLSWDTSAQIVNMENQRYRTDTTGWSGNINGNFALTNYGQKVFAVDANTHIQYQSKKSLYLLLGSYGFLKGDEQSFIDYRFLHFRYNYKLGKVVRAEAFVQLQQNAITKIQSRFLVGAGPRFKIIATHKWRIYAGTLAMYEIEKQTGKAGQIMDWRSSDYLSFTLFPNELTQIIATTYYQPVFNNIGDYRLLNQCTVKLKAGRKIFVNINWNYQFDSTPADGVPKDTYALSMGVELAL